MHPPTPHASHFSCDLTGRSAVVTGASSGIGRAIALALAAAGADILVHARSNQQALEEIAEWIGQLGRTSMRVLHDLNTRAEQDALVDTAWKWRPIDIWINNAGVDILTGEIAQLAFDEKLTQLWQVDVESTIRLSRSVGARMRERGHGVLINMGWDQALCGMAGDSGEMFAAAKGAVMNFTLSLAKSLAPQVRVLCIAPGWIRTKWGEHASEDWQIRAESESLLGRWGTPEDVARVVRFLASEDAAFLNGQIIQINGGRA
ncbi:MAG: SDR family oxidoreductase [Pirellulales bacterium]|nr:SDR family oxidoreductase [Pirellulales bacterium]